MDETTAQGLFAHGSGLLEVSAEDDCTIGDDEGGVETENCNCGTVTKTILLGSRYPTSSVKTETFEAEMFKIQARTF